jgi:transaldolase/glucose-6-phosphate isomerase
MAALAVPPKYSLCYNVATIGQGEIHMTQLHIEARLGRYKAAVDAALRKMAAEHIMERIWARDHTVWSPAPTEITNRLGWLDIPRRMQANVPAMQALLHDVRSAGYTHALLLGMGGSSLAPELFARTLARPGYLQLAVLDSTDPGAVLAHAAALDPQRTLVIVSTKSGGTVETFSFFRFFYNWTLQALGAERVGEHFVAITDPGSSLADLAHNLHFRATFLNDPEVGGRNSALSYFGLVPAALAGVDLSRLLAQALAAAEDCGPQVPVADNPAAHLGAILGELAKLGRDKLTFFVSPEAASFADWAEQLIAESTGKQGRGILPVVGEPPGPPRVYGADRVFVELRLTDTPPNADNVDNVDNLDNVDRLFRGPLAALRRAGHPVLGHKLRDRYDLGGQIFLWELATAVAGHCLGINPFDQPNVEAAKVLARKVVAEYKASGALPAATPALTADGMAVYGDTQAHSPLEALRAFLQEAQPGAYVALQAYLTPTPATDAALLGLRVQIRDRLHLPTTVGYGPRFLHSTGQLHKGDAGRGLFIQLTADDAQDVPIPDEAGAPGSSITFGVLKAAQVAGDRQALLDAGRRVIRFHLGPDAVSALTRLTAAWE